MYPKSDEPGDIHMLQQWTVNSETELTMYYFKYCYIGINRANTVIERVSGGNLNETVKNRVVGEALFLRAWNYFNLVRAYGRVPLYTEPISSLEETTPQMAESIDKIYDRILEDLLAAEKMLTVNKVFGRIDKVGAGPALESLPDARVEHRLQGSRLRLGAAQRRRNVYAGRLLVAQGGFRL